MFNATCKDSLFCTKPRNKTKSRVLFSNMTIVFQNCSQKYPNKDFWSDLPILIFAGNFAFRKIRG